MRQKTWWCVVVLDVFSTLTHHNLWSIMWCLFSSTLFVYCRGIPIIGKSNVKSLKRELLAKNYLSVFSMQNPCVMWELLTKKDDNNVVVSIFSNKFVNTCVFSYFLSSQRWTTLLSLCWICHISIGDNSFIAFADSRMRWFG